MCFLPKSLSVCRSKMRFTTCAPRQLRCFLCALVLQFYDASNELIKWRDCRGDPCYCLLRHHISQGWNEHVIFFVWLIPCEQCIINSKYRKVFSSNVECSLFQILQGSFRKLFVSSCHQHLQLILSFYW